MKRYDFDHVIDRTNTYCTQWDYVQDRFGVPGLLPFTISDMDFAVSDEIAAALQKRIAHPIYGYSRWRNDDYLNTIVSWYAKRFGCTIRKEWIYYSPSVMYSVAKMIQMMSREQAGVAMFTPAYDAFYKVIEKNRRVLNACELTCTDGVYTIDYEKLEQALAKSDVFLLCNPHNPVGRVWREDELRRIIALCEKHRVSIISDDIHMDIVFGDRFHPILQYESKAPMVICTSPSKSFNTPALGGSYILIPDAALGERFETMTRYTEYVNSPTILGVVSTIAAYQSEAWLEQLLAYLRENLMFTISYIRQNMPKLDVRMPEGCYFAWIGFSRLGVEDDVMQRALIEQGKVAIMSGQAYGAKQHLRFHAGCPRGKVEEGLRRLWKAYQWLEEQREIKAL